jgi:hypothetical protein
MNQSYNVNHLPVEEKKELCRRAKAVSYQWWADKLDCDVSCCRQQIQVDFEEFLKHLDQSTTVLTMIWRMTLPPSYLEVGFGTMSGEISYFLWIKVSPEHIPGLVEGFRVHAYT